MLKIVIAITITAIAVSSAFAGFGDVVSSFPKPPRPGLSFGLAWDGAYLWFCGEPSTLFVQTTTTGSIVSSFDVGGTYSYIRSLTFDGEYLWYSRHRLGKPIWYVRTTTTGSHVSSFGHVMYTEYGLTWEPGYLWCGPAKCLTTGSIVATFKPPFPMGKDLAWYGHSLWTGGSNDKYMYEIATTGSIVASFAVPGDTYAGPTTFDGAYLWLMNAERWVYQIDIDVVGMNPGSMGKIKGLYR